MRSYATSSDLYAAPWNLDLDDREGDALLMRASTLVDSLIITAIYATDDDGKPTDPRVKDALRDATCAQASWFSETGDTGSGAAGRFNSMSLGSASLSGGGTGSGTNTDAATSAVSPEAVRILMNAGLVRQGPISW